MLPLFAAFILLALAIRRLRRTRSDDYYDLSKAGKVGGASEKSLAHKKLLEEAFEHAPFTFDIDDNPAEDDTEDQKPHPILILYATEYGFALQVAKSIATTLSESDEPKLYPRVVNVLHYATIDFSQEPFIIFVCSTTGDGVPPNEASSFLDALQSERLTVSPTSNFSVLALGDRAYPHFCRAGAIFDELFPKDRRLIQRGDIDQEDWDTINEWTNNLRDKIALKITSEKSDYVIPDGMDYLPVAIKKYAKTLSSRTNQYTRNNPFTAKLSLKSRLTGPVMKDGHKEVVRIELDVSGSGLSYEVGDAVGVIPSNNPSHVNRVLRALASNGDEMVRLPEDSSNSKSNDVGHSLESALTDNLDIANVRPSLIYVLARFTSSPIEIELARRILGFDPRDPKYASNASKMTIVSDYGKEYLNPREIIDILSDFPSSSISAQQLVDCLRPLHARYYSISSTAVTKPTTLAATVDVVRYNTLGMERQGVASTFLIDRCREKDSSIPIFLTHNPNFRLPKDTTKPIVMIGPGTGIAPFIAFIEERAAVKATGENVLFFGCRFSDQDFLYENELKGYESDGQLVLHTAFSRDGEDKIYVQNRMSQVGDRLWELVSKQKAHVYVCGDGGRMADDVDRVWKNIAMEHGGLDSEGADAFMKELSNGKRYQRDVWVS